MHIVVVSQISGHFIIPRFRPESLGRGGCNKRISQHKAGTTEICVGNLAHVTSVPCSLAASEK